MMLNYRVPERSNLTYAGPNIKIRATTPVNLLFNTHANYGSKSNAIGLGLGLIRLASAIPTKVQYIQP